jgi:hypothetical protein
MVHYNPCRWEHFVFFVGFLSLFRVCVLYRKAWRWQLTEDGIKPSSSRLRSVMLLASSEDVWRFVFDVSHSIGSVFLLIYVSLHRRWLLLSCVGPLGFWHNDFIFEGKLLIKHHICSIIFYLFSLIVQWKYLLKCAIWRSLPRYLRNQNMGKKTPNHTH